MQYSYTAKDRSGKPVSGQLEAESMLAARKSLRSQGLFPTTLTTASQPASAGGRSLTASRGVKRTSSVGSTWRMPLRRRVPGKDLLMVLSQLSIMCQSGDDLADALRSVAAQCTQPVLRQVLEDTHREVNEGVRFSVAIGRHRHVFSDTTVAAIAAGEHAGRLVEVLDRLTQLQRRDQAMRSNIASMMIYPGVLLSVTGLVMVAMLFFVLPQFAQVFDDLERPIPPLTAALLDSGTLLRGYWLPISLGLMTLVGVALGPRTKPRLQQLIDHYLMHAVVIRSAVRPLMAGRVFRLLGTMLENGVPLLEGVRLCAQAASNRLLQEMFRRVEKDILNGDGMAGALSASTCLPPGAAHMVSTGERTGQLASVLISVGDYFEAEGERQLKSLVKLLEPAIIIGLGGVISVIVLSIMLPMLDMSSISG